MPMPNVDRPALAASPDLRRQRHASPGPLPRVLPLLPVLLVLLVLPSACAQSSDVAPTAPITDEAAEDPPPSSAAAPAPSEEPPPKPDAPLPAPEEARPEAWPEPLPWAKSPYPERTQVVASEAGDLSLEMTLTMAPVIEVARPWLEGLRAQGFVEARPCTIDEAAATLSCAYRQSRDPDGERLALLDLDPGSGGPTSATIELSLHLLPPGHRPRQDLPGRCVPPPARERRVKVDSSGIDQSGEHHRSSRDWHLSTYPTFDLDGDGVQDVLVPATKAGACPWDIPMDVYIMRGACGHRVGTVVGRLRGETATAPFVRGLREIRTRAEWADFDMAPSGADDPPPAGGDSDSDSDDAKRRRHSFIPSHHTRERLYRFDGKTLRVISDHDSVGTCHHCATSSCWSG